MDEYTGYVLSIIIAAGLGFIPAEIAKKKGYDHYWLWWFYGWMLFIVALIHTLCMADKVQPVRQFQMNDYGQPQPNSKTGGADEIMKYKELLDSGAITQEEFDAKKKQLLEL